MAAIRAGTLENAQLNSAHRALLEYVKKITEAAYRTTTEDVQALRDAGWSEPQIAEAVYVTALFAFFNRVADAFGFHPISASSSYPPKDGRRIQTFGWRHSGFSRTTVRLISPPVFPIGPNAQHRADHGSGVGTRLPWMAGCGRFSVRRDARLRRAGPLYVQPIH